MPLSHAVSSSCSARQRTARSQLMRAWLSFPFRRMRCDGVIHRWLRPMADGLAADAKRPDRSIGASERPTAFVANQRVQRLATARPHNSVAQQGRLLVMYYRTVPSYSSNKTRHDKTLLANSRWSYRFGRRWLRWAQSLRDGNRPIQCVPAAYCRRTACSTQWAQPQ
jgi:hypothetical protein